MACSRLTADWCISVPPPPNVKGFDEDSAASISTTQDETQDSYLTENGLPGSSTPFQEGYMLAASYWPKVLQQSRSAYT